MATRTARAPKPFTLEHFRRYTSRLVYDDAERRELEDWQLEVARDVFRGHQEVWLLVPEGNGKSTFIAEMALYGADYSPTPWIPVAASSRDQARIIYIQAAGFVANTPGLSKRFACHDGYRKIKSRRNGGEGIQIFAASPGTGDGVIPYPFAIIDELHRQDLRLYRLWNGKLWKRGGQILVISTAGEPGSDFEETRDRIRKQAKKVTRKAGGAFVRAQGEGIVLHDWAVRDRRKTDDMELVARANPREDITAEVLRRKRESPTMTPEHWQRFVCNIATRISGQAVLPEEWDALLDEEGLAPDPDARTFGWLDLGWKIDTTAMGVLVWESDERRVIAGVKVLEPPVAESDIVEGLLELQTEHGPEGWVYDPNAGGQQMAQLLEKGEHPLQIASDAPPLVFIEHAQDNAPMALAASRLDEAIRAGWIRHDGDPDLRKHVLNSVKKPLGGEKWKYDRPPDAKGERRGKYPIDALTGVLMGHSVAFAEMTTESAEPVVEVYG